MLPLAGCQGGSAGSSGSSGPLTLPHPSPSAFASGLCQGVAPDVLALGRDRDRLGTSPSPPKAVLADLQAAQDRLRAALDGAPQPYASALQGLSVQVGLVRLRSVGNEYDPALLTDYDAAYRQAIAVCVPGAAGPSATARP